jgi:hypothetical protein
MNNQYLSDGYSLVLTFKFCLYVGLYNDLYAKSILSKIQSLTVVRHYFQHCYKSMTSKVNLYTDFYNV